MTAHDLLEFEMIRAGKQIDACLNGMAESAYDEKCSPNGMTPREMLEHLCDAYEAFIVASRGEKYDFGSFVVEDKSTANLRSVFSSQRAKAVAAALGKDDDKHQREAYEYIVGHDNYHVGQLCLCRMQSDPAWDTYAIYES
jgi:uncharacterized damage-inducible protein DinB